MLDAVCHVMHDPAQSDDISALKWKGSGLMSLIYVFWIAANRWYCIVDIYMWSVALTNAFSYIFQHLKCQHFAYKEI